LSTSLEYLAGYFDGEGCVTFSKVGKNKEDQGWYSLRVAIDSADIEVLQLFVEALGGGLRKRAPRKGHKRQQYSWYVQGARAQEVLTKLLPYLVAKRPQAELALIPDLRPKAGQRMSKEQRQIRLEVLSGIRAINQRVTIEPLQVN
jgi:LAGLIDADG endonuclease